MSGGEREGRGQERKREGERIQVRGREKERVTAAYSIIPLIHFPIALSTNYGILPLHVLS